MRNRILLGFSLCLSSFRFLFFFFCVWVVSKRFDVSVKRFIDTALNTPGCKVLVHCNGGISLSPAFVVMFVMQHYQLSWEEALHMVQNRRYCISPNGGFLTQIKVRIDCRKKVYILMKKE